MTSHTVLTWEAVRDEAERQLRTRGSTTTLDVKRGLRARGYWAVQADVSYLMRHLAELEGWSLLDNGRYRTYVMAMPMHYGFPVFLS